MKLTLYKIIRNLLPRLIIVFTIILIFFALYIIYQNVWQVFTQSEKIFLLKEEVIVAKLKTDTLQKIQEKLENKKREKVFDLENLKNPFGFAEKIEVE